MDKTLKKIGAKIWYNTWGQNSQFLLNNSVFDLRFEIQV